LQTIVSYRLFQAQYRQVIKTPRFEACSYLNLTRDITEKGIDAVKFPDVGIFNTSMLENIVYRFILYLSETAPKRIAPCPLVKDWLNDYNISA
jgi:hypothetical protein